MWSKAQVLDWVSYQAERHRCDPGTIDLSRCELDGAALCRCAPEELRLLFGPLGDQLYSQLWDLSEYPYPGREAGCPGEGKEGEPTLWALTPSSSASSFPDELSWIMELLEKDSLALQEPLGEQGPFGESPSSILPQPDGPQLGEPGPPLTTHPLPPDQESPFAQEMLEDCRQASPTYPGSFGAGAPSPGSSDVSTAGEPSLRRLPAAALPDVLSPDLYGHHRPGFLRGRALAGQCLAC